MHTLRYNYINALIYFYSYMFRSSLAYHNGVYSSLKESLDLKHFLLFQLMHIIIKIIEYQNNLRL
jgi:hypothetical protein